ncbi:MAG: patatin-like phospholipase family protein [Nitrospinota bacterium]|nr:patatin-like phospholipase family protein [Nitrospinota bacterium]
MKTGLSLSGGGARGLSHLGSMDELQRAGIKIDMVAGCSVGALLGAMYAAEPDVRIVREKILKQIGKDDGQIIPVEYIDEDTREERRSVFRKVAGSLRKSIYYGISLAQIAHLATSRLTETFANLLPNVDIQDLELPFSCSATDLNSQRPYYFTKGPLIEAVAASCSIPGLYQPIKKEGMILVDGAWSALHHGSHLRERGADFVIAVDIQHEIRDNDLINGLDVVVRSNMAARSVLSQIQIKEADVIIRPDICHINWWDFGSSASCIVLGKEEAERQMTDIKRKIRRRKIRKFFLG